jgi:hypothetical protein
MSRGLGDVIRDSLQTSLTPANFINTCKLH